MFAEALHLCIANIENSLLHVMGSSKFLSGAVQRGIIVPGYFKESPIFQEALRSF